MSGPANKEVLSGLPRAARLVLGLAVLCAALAMCRTYHARNWVFVRDAAIHVARCMHPFRRLPAPCRQPGGPTP